MPPAEAGVHERALGGTRGSVVVWTVADALLAVPLEDTIEIAALDEAGRALSRAGPLDVRTLPGLGSAVSPRKAVVVRGGDTAVAIAADDVDGVHPWPERASAAVPGWLAGVAGDHLRGVVRLQDGRLAALVAVERLSGP